MAKPLSNFVPQDTPFPFMGLNRFTPANMTPPNFSPNLLNVLVTDGILKKRRGYIQLGDQLDKAGTVQTERVLALFEMTALSGTRILTAFTKTRIYRYDSSADLWLDITPRGTTLAIIGVSAGASGTFTVATDVTADYPAGATFAVFSSTGNDADYEVASSVFGANTVITVTGTIPDATVDGSLAEHKTFTGDEDDFWDVIQGVSAVGVQMLATNGVDNPIEWDGSAAAASDLDFSTFTGFVTAKAIAIYFDHLVIGDIQDAASNPQIVAWSDTGDFTEWTIGNAGVTFVNRAEGAIKRLLPFGDLLIIYARDTITVMRFVGGDAIMAIGQTIQGLDLPSSGAIVDLGEAHAFMGTDNFYIYRGGRDIIKIGDVVANQLREDLAAEFASRARAFRDGRFKRVYWVIPTGETTTKVYVWDYDANTDSRNRWTVFDYSDNAFSVGVFSQDENVTWDSTFIAGLKWTDMAERWQELKNQKGQPQLVTASAGKVYMADSVSSDDTSDIDGLWDSPDFMPPEGFVSTFARWVEIELELRGTTVDVAFSTDKGLTFTAAETLTLNSEWNTYKVLIDVTAKEFRLRLRDNSQSANGYESRFYRLWAKEGGV